MPEQAADSRNPRVTGLDVRDSANPVVLSAARWLARVNARHPWNHNEYFHGWVLRNLPARRQAAVDVGCGTGVLTEKLAPRFARVTGIDINEAMAAAASARLAGEPRVSIMRCGFDAFAEAAGDGEADLITMVAVLHHLDLGDTLRRIPRLLAPSGRLLVVGLAKVGLAGGRGGRPDIGSGQPGHGPDQAPAASPPG